MIEVILNFFFGALKDYLLVFLMISSGVVFYVAGKNGKPVHEVLQRYFWRLILWELFITPVLFIFNHLVYTKGGWEYRKALDEQKEFRDKFTKNISRKVSETVEEAWYNILWFWLWAKVKIACGALIGLLSFGVPAMASAQETEPDTPNSESGLVLIQDEDKNQAKIVPCSLIIAGSECGGRVVPVMLGTKIISGRKSIGVDIIRWNFVDTGQADHEIMIWPSVKAMSQLGYGIISQQNGGMYATFNGCHIVPLGNDGAKLDIFWQGKKGMSGRTLTPDLLEINNLKVTFPVGKSIAIGPDSQFCLKQGQKAVWRVGGVLDVKCSRDTTIRLRHFAGNRTTPTKTQVWFIIRFGGGGP